MMRQNADQEVIVLNIGLWALQFLLAAAFLAHGWLFLSPPANMVQQLNESIPPPLRLFIGAAEVLAAVGLTVPALARRAVWLVPSAAAGLALVMVSATIYHIIRGELSSAAVTAILWALTAFVAYARWRVRPVLAHHPRRRNGY
jgi:hypothetical protein